MRAAGTPARGAQRAVSAPTSMLSRSSSCLPAAADMHARKGNQSPAAGANAAAHDSARFISHSCGRAPGRNHSQPRGACARRTKRAARARAARRGGCAPAAPACARLRAVLAHEAPVAGEARVARGHVLKVDHRVQAVNKKRRQLAQRELDAVGAQRCAAARGARARASGGARAGVARGSGRRARARATARRRAGAAGVPGAAPHLRRKTPRARGRRRRARGLRRRPAGRAQRPGCVSVAAPAQQAPPPPATPRTNAGGRTPYLIRRVYRGGPGGQGCPGSPP